MTGVPQRVYALFMSFDVNEPDPRSTEMRRRRKTKKERRIINDQCNRMVVHLMDQVRQDGGDPGKYRTIDLSYDGR